MPITAPRLSLLIGAGLIISPATLAHVSEQGFVLLLPTGVYISAGVMAVALTVLVTIALSTQRLLGLFSTRRIFSKLPMAHGHIATSLFSLAVLAGLLVCGITGSRLALENPLPLFIWTIWWIVFFIAQGLIGDLWHWFNPWTGLYGLIRRGVESATLKLPQWVGVWPGVLLFLLFVSFALVDPAPDDPARLAAVVGAYWIFTFVCMLLFGGQRWLTQGECFTLLLQRYAQLAPFGLKTGALQVGLPGWRAVSVSSVSVSQAVFILVILGSGSFDGLNETFWWLAKINVNPLEFPGRSALIVQNTGGLLVSISLLLCVYAACIKCGLWLSYRLEQHSVSFGESFCHLSLAILPIAFAYHFAHYLSVLLVNGQYALAAASDPLGRGADLLNLGTFYVTTGFFNAHDSVEMIWIAQAAAVVSGHMISVVMAHAIAIKLYGQGRLAAVSQIPLASFMILYTFFGLWLLASPRGA